MRIIASFGSPYISQAVLYWESFWGRYGGNGLLKANMHVVLRIYRLAILGYLSYCSWRRFSNDLYVYDGCYQDISISKKAYPAKEHSVASLCTDLPCRVILIEGQRIQAPAGPNRKVFSKT